MNAIIGINIKAAIFGSNSNTSTNKGSRTKFKKKVNMFTEVNLKNSKKPSLPDTEEPKVIFLCNRYPQIMPMNCDKIIASM